jgi:hypothetical protein
MGLGEIQRAMARLYVDGALRDRFFAEPSSVGAELGLDAAEAQGLACVSQRQVEQFADSLRNKRRAQVRQFVPMAARAIGQGFASLFERYVAESAPRGSKADLDDAVGFVEWLRRQDHAIEPPWSVDLARYELAWRQAARSSILPIVRRFRFPVATLTAGADRIAPQASLALWWRPTRRGRVRHVVIKIPRVVDY